MTCTHHWKKSEAKSQARCVLLKQSMTRLSESLRAWRSTSVIGEVEPAQRGDIRSTARQRRWVDLPSLLLSEGHQPNAFPARHAKETTWHRGLLLLSRSQVSILRSEGYRWWRHP